MTQRLFNFDLAEELSSDEAIAVFLTDAFESNDIEYTAYALGMVARSKRMAQIAAQTGLSLEQLCRTFSENDSTSLKTILTVMKVLGIELIIKLPAIDRSVNKIF